MEWNAINFEKNHIFVKQKQREFEWVFLDSKYRPSVTSKIIVLYSAARMKSYSHTNNSVKFDRIR